MKIDFVKTLEASAPYIPGRIYFEESTSLIKVATASNQYRVFGGVRSADYDSSTDILTIQNGNGDEIYIDFSQYVNQDEYEDDQYVVSVALNELNGKIDEIDEKLNEIPDLIYRITNDFINYAEYDSDTKTINFYNYNSSSAVSSIDATAFIKDGMVNDVSIHNGTGANANVSCLVVTFNTDASTEDIEIPLTKIFNPSNYYDTSTADNRFVRKVTSTDNAVARFDGTDGSIQNSGVTITDSNNIVTPGALYLTSIASSVSSSTSRLYFGSTSSPYNYITANTSGVFGIYRASDNKGVSCYPDQNFFSTSNIDLGRSQSLWKNLYMSGTITDGTNTLTRPNKSGTIAVTSDIPTDASVAAWGYTKNALTGVNFNGVDASVTNGVASILPIFDSVPTEDSSNFITSGAVYSTIADTEEVFAAAINDIQTNLTYMTEEMYGIGEQLYGTLKNFQINGVTQQKTGNNADTVNFILDDVPTQDSSYHGVSSAGLYNVITQNERVVAEVMNDLNDRLLAVEELPVVDSSTVSNWGFTKNGLTGVSFNGVDASVTNGVASITATIPTQITDASVEDWGYIKSYTETDPTVPAWAKAANKPTYTASEVGALPDTTTIPTQTTDASVAGWGYIKTIADASIAALGYTKNAGTLTGVKFNNTNATINGTVAEITATIPAAPGTLNTNNTTAQTASASEALSGTINLHKIAKTGTYSDLIGAPLSVYTSDVGGTWYPLYNEALGANGSLSATVISTYGIRKYDFSDWSWIEYSYYSTATGTVVNNLQDYLDEHILPEVTSLDSGRFLYVAYDSTKGYYWSAASPIWYNNNDNCINTSPFLKLVFRTTNYDTGESLNISVGGVNHVYNSKSNYGPSDWSWITKTDLSTNITVTLQDTLTGKQNTLVGSGTGQNIKTVNNNSLVGSGNVSVGTLTGVKFNNASATINGTVAEITATIPAAPGTLKTNATTAQTASASEALSGTITLHKVAKTGTYSDLIGTPTIPAAPGTLKTNNTTAQTASASESLSGTINLHKVAKTGTYSDLIGTPTIPTVNNGTLTIQKNGTTVTTFTANQSGNATANITVNELPAVTSSDNGKILEVVNGVWAAASPITVYSGSNAPNNSTGNNGDIYIQS